MSAVLLTAPAAPAAGSSAVDQGPLGELLHEHHPGAGIAEGTAVPYPAYDAHVRALARRGRPVAAALAELVTHAARRAADRLRPPHEACRRADGHVCAAVPVALAHAPGAATAAARALHDAVGRPNLMVRLAATGPGLEAITACLGQGIGVHAVAVVSLERYAEVADAVLRGLEHAAGAGLDPAALAAAVSLNVAGLDEAAAHSTATGAATAVPLGPAAATAHLAQRIHQEIHQGARWRALARQGARPHRLLPDIPRPRDCRDAQAWQVLGALPSHGICYRELTATVEAAVLARSAAEQQRTRHRVAAALHTAAGREAAHRTP
ncbi:transaldolase family protein [Streptomyces sp. NPDC005574]|uniref:transaldolase family protein n=1 Tax=Streptomyces sp. NPDC005574 TaxID=3156891 RepID=UPI0033A5BD65